MIKHYITGVEVTSAQISAVDRLGMYVVVGMPDGQSGKLRLPFPRPCFLFACGTYPYGEMGSFGTYDLIGFFSFEALPSPSPRVA
ncbi:unnamed protein product [Hapterophycus canaliculatus]